MLFRSAQLPTACRSILIKAVHMCGQPRTPQLQNAGVEFQLIFHIFRGKQAAIFHLADILGPSMMRRWPVSFSMNPASPVATSLLYLWCLLCFWDFCNIQQKFRRPVKPHHHPKFDFNTGRGHANSICTYLAIWLLGDKHAFCLAVKLF